LTGQVSKIDTETRFGSTTMRNQIASSLGLLRRSDTVLHAIDLGGVRSDAEGTSRGAGPGTHSPSPLAAAAGGELRENSNQLPAELEKLSNRTAPNYLLSYQPSGLKKPGTFHELKVTVLAPGAKVTARAGYTEPLPYAALTPVERILSAGDLLASSQD